MSNSNSAQKPRRVHLLEIIIVLLLFLGGVYVGKAYLNAVRTDRSAIVGTELLYGPPAMYAAGYGFYQPDTSVSPELRAFLRNEVDALALHALPAEIPAAPSTVASYHRYLLYTVAAFWCVFSISWSSLELLAALMLGWCAVAAYGLFRLGMGRIISLALALVFMLSPPILIMLSHLRDFGKAPFILSTIFLLVYVIKTKPDMFRLRFLLPLLGVLIGIGMGFRQDIIILIPPAILVTCIALYRSGKGTWRQRVGIGVLFLVCLFGMAWPMLGKMEGGAEPYHPLVQGYSMKRMESLGIEPAAYAPLACGQDNYVFSVLYDYYRRVNHEPNAHFEYNSPGIEAAGRQWLLDMGIHFPADLITRGYASVLRSLRYADAYIPWFAQLPLGLHGLESIHLRFAVFMHRFGLLLGLVAALLLGARNVTAGLGLIVFVVYVFGYVGLQCEFRHAFHLSFVPFWVVGFLVANLARVIRRPAICCMTGKQWQTLAYKVLLFVLCGLVLVVAPLYSLRLYQQYMAKPFVEEIITSACTQLETRKTTKFGWTLFTETERSSTGVATEEPAGKVTAIKRMLNEMEEWLQGGDADPLLWDTHTRYMVAEFDAATLPEWFYIRYTSEGAWNDFSQVVRLPSPGKMQGTIRYFFPVYELYMRDDRVAARNLFAGVGVPEQQAGTLQGLYEIKDLSKIHFLMHLITIDSVLPLPLYQKINFMPDPLMYYVAENDPVAIATQAEQAMRMGRTREAIFFYRTALLLSPITSHRLHIARVLMTLDELDAAFDGALDARNMTKDYAQETAQLLFDLGITYKDADNYEKMDAAFNTAKKLLMPLIEKERGGSRCKVVSTPLLCPWGSGHTAY